MIQIKFILGFIVLFNNGFTIQKIFENKVFYNFVSYENELYVGSNSGIYKIDFDDSEYFKLKLFDGSISGPIKSDFSKDDNFKIKFINPKSILLNPKIYSKSITDYAYLQNNLFIIARGKLLIYKDVSYTFSPYKSVRSITKNGIGSYGGVYIDGKKLNKITYTDGQVREFDSVTFVCYNGLLAYKNKKETKLYNNDNSIRTKGEYGNISDIFLISNSNYLIISNKGIFNYDYESNIFEIIYTSQNKIIPIRNKINDRINDRKEFHFIDNKRYISLNVNSYNINIIDNNFNYDINDILESDLNGNNFYAISNNKSLLSLKRTKDGLELISQTPIKMTAHTITDYNNLIFLSGNNGLSVYDKTKKKMYDNFIVDEFNSSAVYKTKNSVSFGSLHGVYTIEDLNDFNKKLIFKDYKISNSSSYIFIGAIVFTIFIILIWIFKKKNITDDQLIFNIKRFIRKNLSIVTLKMLESEFNLDYNEINGLNKNFKPAKYIKKERLELTQKMLLDKRTISEVSEKTGYSETYILKNKYRFLKG